jgi:hypothetical protein
VADWFVGMKVVCVIGPRPRCMWEILPTRGHIYTIRDIRLHSGGWVDFLLDEIVNRPFHYLEGFCEAHFRARRFRPVVSPRADISVFERILADVNAREGRRGMTRPLTCEHCHADIEPQPGLDGIVHGYCFACGFVTIEHDFSRIGGAVRLVPSRPLGSLPDWRDGDHNVVVPFPGG